MKQIFDYTDALNLLKDHTLISKPYGGKAIIYRLFNQQILMINNDFKTFISEETFKNHFENSIFYYLEVEDDDEINQEYVKHRQ